MVETVKLKLKMTCLSKKKKPASEAKTWVWEEFGEAKEKNF